MGKDKTKVMVEETTTNHQEVEIKRVITPEEAVSALQTKEAELQKEFQDGLQALIQRTGYGLEISQGIIIKKIQK